MMTNSKMRKILNQKAKLLILNTMAPTLLMYRVIGRVMEEVTSMMGSVGSSKMGSLTIKNIDLTLKGRSKEKYYKFVGQVSSYWPCVSCHWYRC